MRGDPSRGRRALEQRRQEREAEARRSVWKRALSRYGPDGEGPLRGAGPGPDARELALALMSLASDGPRSGLPKGADPKLAAFVAGKELGLEAEGLEPPSQERGLLDEFGARAALSRWMSRGSERAFALAEAFVEGVSARAGGECQGALMALWLADTARAGDAERLGRLLRSGAGANAKDPFNRIEPPLIAALEGGSEACVEALLSFGAAPAPWRANMFQAAMRGMFWGDAKALAAGAGPAGPAGAGMLDGRAQGRSRAWRLERGSADTGAGWEAIASDFEGAAQALAQRRLMERGIPAALDRKNSARPRI